MKLRATLLSSALLFLAVATLFFYGQLMFYQQHIAAYRLRTARYQALSLVVLSQKLSITENQTLQFNLGTCTLKQGHFQVKLTSGQQFSFTATQVPK